MPSHIAIRCLTPFPHGTTQNVSGRKYHFAFNAQGHAVAMVAEQDVATILSIGAGYQKYDGAAADSDEAIVMNDTPVVVPIEGGELVEEQTTTYLKPTKTQFKQSAKAAKADAVKAKVAAEQERLASAKTNTTGVHKSAATKAKDEAKAAKKPASKKLKKTTA